jgi:hypothetical protein
MRVVKQYPIVSVLVAVVVVVNVEAFYCDGGRAAIAILIGLIEGCW